MYQCVLNCDSRMLADFLRFIFPPEEGTEACRVSTSRPVGALMVAYAQSSVLPFQVTGDHLVKLDIPWCPMTEIEIYETEKKVSLPSSWAEMTPEQVQSVFRIHDQAIRKRWPVLERNVQILYALLGIHRGWRRPKPRMAENVAMMYERCLEFLGEEGLTFDGLANPLPSAGMLHGPAELLQDLSTVDVVPEYSIFGGWSGYYMEIVLE